MTGSNVVPFSQPAVPAVSFGDMQQLAAAVARSGLFGIKTPDQALALMALAQAEGRHPATVARDYHIINSSPSKKAEAMQRDFLMAGGKIEWHELTDDAVDATFSHPLGGTARIKWDSARCKQAGLTSGNHAKFPRQMKRSRVVSEGVRTVWPLATSGFYVPEEVAEFATQPQPTDTRADLDAFAKPAEIIDAETAEILDAAAIIAQAHAFAREGTKALGVHLKSLTDEAYDIVAPLLGTREQPGELRQIARQADDARAAEPHSPAGDLQSPDRKDSHAPAEKRTLAPAGDAIPDLLGGEARHARSYHATRDGDTSDDWAAWHAAINAMIEAGDPHAAVLRDNGSDLAIFEQVDPMAHNKIMRALGGE